MIGGARAGTAVAGSPEADVEYPEGPKVPEGDLQMTMRLGLVFALRQWLASRADAATSWASSDINVYWVQGDNTKVVAPDLAVAFGVDVPELAGRGVYKVWDAGAPPAFALEIASHTTYKRDLEAKPEIFAELGVSEYWRLDPTGEDYFEPALQGDRRRAGRWETIPITPDARGGLVGRSAALGLELHWQPPKLRLYDPAARAWLLDPDDQNEARQAAEAHAESEAAQRRSAEARAESEAAQRRAAEARATTAEARAESEAARRRALEAEIEELRRRGPSAPPTAGLR